MHIPEAGMNGKNVHSIGFYAVSCNPDLIVVHARVGSDMDTSFNKIPASNLAPTRNYKYSFHVTSAISMW